MAKKEHKLVAAMKEAVKVARCRHKWVRLSTRVQDGMVVGETDYCEKCKCRRTGFVHGYGQGVGTK